MDEAKEMMEDKELKELAETDYYEAKENLPHIEDELKDPARREFDNKVLQSIGAQDLYDKIKDSLLSLQHTRHCIK